MKALQTLWMKARNKLDQLSHWRRVSGGASLAWSEMVVDSMAWPTGEFLNFVERTFD
jgi:hypothetical protein